MGSPHGCTHNIWAGRRYCNADLLWLASAYGFLQGAWPFGIIEAIWAGVAVRRWRIRTCVYEYTHWVARALSITRTRIWRKILEVIRLPPPLLPVGRGRIVGCNIRPAY